MSSKVKEKKTTNKDAANFKKGEAIIVHGVIADSLFDKLRERKFQNIIILEGRPSFEAARSTSRALLKRKITPTIISDNMAGFLFYQGLVNEVWLSYQIVDKQGALCDIGSLILGVLGKEHNVKVHAYPAGKRLHFIADKKDILFLNGQRITSNRIKGYVPLMEWVPGKYLSKVY